MTDKPRYTYKPAPNALNPVEQQRADLIAAAEARQTQFEAAYASSEQLLANAARSAAENHDRLNEEREKQAAAQLVETKAEAMRAGALASYIETTGSDVGFGALWPSLKAEILKAKVLAGVGSAKSASTNDVAKRYISTHYGQH